MAFSLVAMQSGYKPGLVCITLMLENPLHTWASALLHQLLGQRRVEEVVEHTNLSRFLVELMMSLVLG